MSQSSPQFTAAQVLEAGQRAEADGNLDHAIQFYRHLLENHAGGPEAKQAGEAVSRLLAQHLPAAQPQQPHLASLARPAPSQANADIGKHGGADSDRTADSFASRGKPPAGPSGEARPGNNGRTSYPPPPERDYYALQHGNYPMPTVARRPDAENPAIMQLPPPPNGYKVGRFLAGMFVVVGWVSILLGMVAAIAGTGLVPGSGALITLVPGLIYGAAGVVGGFSMILVGQAARALFDGANSARELVAIERTKARFASLNGNR